MFGGERGAAGSRRERARAGGGDARACRRDQGEPPAAEMSKKFMENFDSARFHDSGRLMLEPYRSIYVMRGNYRFHEWY